MPYYLCPRCGGTDSYGQWEQRFSNQRITIRDNQNRPIGSSDGGLGISNVRQQYCRSCVSVKMDLRFTRQDLKIAGYAVAFFFGLGFLLSIPHYVRSIADSELPNFNGISISASPIFFAISISLYFLSILLIWLSRKAWITRQVKKSVANKFYMPKAPRFLKVYIGWFTLIYAVTILTVLMLGIKSN